MKSSHVNMKTRGVFWLAHVLLGLVAASGSDGEGPGLLLARMEVAGPVQTLSVDVHAFLPGRDGTDDLLVVARREQLESTGWPYQILDRFMGPDHYALIRERRAGARQALAADSILFDEGRNWLVRIAPGDWERLSEAGFALSRLSAAPLAWRPPYPLAQGEEPGPGLQTVTYSPLVADKLARVLTTNLFRHVAELSGEAPALAGGSYTNIRTRHTSSGVPIQRATAYAYDRFASLGLNTFYHSWTNGSYDGTIYTNRNVVAAQASNSASSEVVLITAHIDNMPSGALAFGADDNASGSAAVLVAAELLSRLRFERTIRYVLFTGEEQGLLGSERYAAYCAAAGDQIVAVLNLDMIAWDSDASPVLEIHTRADSNPGYAADLQIYSIFTNVVALYGLSGQLTPVLRADGVSYSDHYPFWNQGYPAILGIEDDYDFTPHYHTTNDRLATLNLPYFTAFTKASIGTLAHLARVAGSAAMDVVEVANTDGRTSGSLTPTRWVARHIPGATETGADPFDQGWTNSSVPAGRPALKIHSAPYGTELATDARPPSSETIFHGFLSVSNPSLASVSGPNKLRFSWVGPSDTGRVYSVRVRVEGAYVPGGQEYACVTNLRTLIAGGGWLSLPELTNVPNGAVYGSVELLAGVLDQASSNVAGRLAISAGGTLRLEAAAQGGASVVDSVWTCTNLLEASPWTFMQSRTNQAALSDAEFEGGWGVLSQELGPEEPGGAPHYYRFLRSWLTPPLD